MRRKTARAILSETTDRFAQPEKLIQFGTTRRAADRCTLYDAPAQFSQCLDCEYRHGSHGLGIVCAHRFGIDPTYVNGILTQISDDSIIPL